MTACTGAIPHTREGKGYIQTSVFGCCREPANFIPFMFEYVNDVLLQHSFSTQQVPKSAVIPHDHTYTIDTVVNFKQTNHAY